MNLSALAATTGLKHPVENVVDVPELLVEIERALDLGRRQHAA